MVYNVILIGGCVDEFVINELTKLSRDFDPEFVVRIAAPMLCGDSNVLSDSRFDGALRSGLLAATLTTCAKLGQQDIRILAPGSGDLGVHECAEVLACRMVDRLYKVRPGRSNRWYH